MAVAAAVVAVLAAVVMTMMTMTWEVAAEVTGTVVASEGTAEVEREVTAGVMMAAGEMEVAVAAHDNRDETKDNHMPAEGLGTRWRHLRRVLR